MDTAPLFIEWRDALRAAGIQRVEGRLIGDDNAFDDRTLGAGWAWDYLTAGYAAPSSALSYNENVAVMRIAPGAAVGDPARVDLGPPGHELDLTIAVTTSAPDAPASIAFERLPGSPALLVRGSMPAGAPTLVLTTTVDNPTRYFVDAFRLALQTRGLEVSGGAWDIDEVDSPSPPAGERRVLAARHSQPLSVLIGYAMKVSQNFYGDMLLKAIGAHAAAAPGGETVGSLETGRTAVRETLTAWGLPVDTLAMYDGSGLSRYNYASADLLVGVLKHAWHDARLRGPFAASLPVGGHDGTLERRMRNTLLDRRVQAKTGTISNVRSLAGYAETAAGEKLVFAIVANHFTAPTAEVDRVMEAVLEELVK
jgi:D-alanyl-D-alanine carboxypeptidase/D-alanyl-D-alanine-endopeptidase (penicillin-binding protein 4)